MRDKTIEIKNNLKGSNSRVDETKNQINGLQHKEEKKQTNNQSEQEEEKRIKKMRIV